MSDAENQTPEASAAPAAGGFTPEPPPPQVDAANVKEMLEDQAVSDDAQGVQVPHETAKKALEAVQILVENNRAASHQLESLMGIVLDAAEVANRSASAVSTTGGQLNRAAEKLIDGAGRTATQAKVVLALAAAVLVGTAGTFSFMTVQLNSKVEQVDAMLLAVGKRAVDLKTRLESLDKMNATLDDINLKQDNSHSVQQAIEDKLTAAVEAARAAPKPAPAPAPAAAPAKTAAPRPEGKSLNQQFAALDAVLKEQSQAVKNLSGQVNSVQSSVANVESLKKDMEALTNLQRQRSQEAAQATLAANAKREKEIKDKERELIRERDQAREREMMRERELAKERELTKERELAKERERERNRAVQYSREQSNPNGSTASNGMPSYTRQGGTETEKQ